MEPQDEIWKAVVGCEGSYEVSNLGQVRSLARCVRLVTRQAGETTRLVPPRILRPGRTWSGHVSVALGRGNSKQVHRLVAEAFLGPCPDGCEVLHRNGIPSDNRVDNLRWGTRSENLIDVFYQKGRRLTREQVLHLRTRQREGFWLGEKKHLAYKWGISPSGISDVLAGRAYSHVR